jgi:DNA-directed RNA polymerase II subunit RPB2
MSDLTDPNSLNLIVDQAIREHKFAQHHLESANEFYETGLPHIIIHGFEITDSFPNTRENEEDRKIDRISFRVTPTVVTLQKPTTNSFRSSKVQELWPNMALATNKTYSAMLSITAEVSVTAHYHDGTTSEPQTEEIKDFRIGRIPVVKGSKLCHTFNKTKEQLVQLGEDPTCPGGFCIVRGSEWAITSVENMKFNEPKCHINLGYEKSAARLDYISKPGGYQNSGQVIMVLSTTDTLTIEISRVPLAKHPLPFYAILRALGVENDRAIYDNIVFSEDETGRSIGSVVVRAFDAKYTTGNAMRREMDPIRMKELIVRSLPPETYSKYKLEEHPENLPHALKTIDVHLDKHLLPHIGTTAASRGEKIRYLCLLIRKLIMTHLRYLEPTDRDSYQHKRVFPAGINLAKSLKTIYNQSVVMRIRRAMRSGLQHNSFRRINLTKIVRDAVDFDEFERLMVQIVSAGHKSSLAVNSQRITNRLSTEVLHRENHMATISSLRQVTANGATTGAKQSGRANEMRRVHQSTLGYICPVDTSTGETVGINKQLAPTIVITGMAEGEVLKEMLRNDPLIIPLNRVQPHEINPRNLKCIYVNGDWIGFTTDTIAVIKKYRKLRRLREIDPMYTIIWDNTTNEASFWYDPGRILRPLLIVYNSHRDPEMFPELTKKDGKMPFKQKILFTEQHVTNMLCNRVTLEDLVNEGVLEYISADEQVNYYLCYCYDKLMVDRENELAQYTHCDIPAAIIGCKALTSPLANHNQATRVIYQINQARQTCGCPPLNWPRRMDKGLFLQYVAERPLAHTLINHHTLPGGTHMVAAIGCYTGYNQEDSSIMSRAAMDRNMFNGCKFTYYQTEVEAKEEITEPRLPETSGLKSANYSKLVNGVVPIGTQLVNGDVIVSKVLRVPSSRDEKLPYTDRSIVYKEHESAIVYNVIQDYNEDDQNVCRVGVRKLRKVTIGDKFCIPLYYQVLTTRGFVALCDVTELDECLTISSDGTTQYQRYVGKPVFDGGEMVNVGTPHLSYMCTGGHKVCIVDTINASTDAIAVAAPATTTMTTTPTKRISLVPARILMTKTSVHATASHATEHIASCTASPTSPTYVHDVIVRIEDMRDLPHGDREPIINELYPRLINHSELAKMFIDALELTQGLPKHFSESTADMIAHVAVLARLDVVISDVSDIANTNTDNTDKDKRVYIKCVNNTAVTPNDYSIVDYDGPVGCLTFDTTHTFYVRSDPSHLGFYTGNSDRSGQKSICAMLLREADMPFTRTGLRPSIIVNPHCIPTRMTIGRLIESVMGNMCAAKGISTDATIFRPCSIEAIGDVLEEYGMNRYGYETFYCGRTGNRMNCPVFTGVVYYQRLQKFVKDKLYSVVSSATDVITNQPLDGGKQHNGGLRIGEMEVACMTTQGLMCGLLEKFTAHSDGFYHYVCRCGMPAVVNHKTKLYKCNRCKDMADIVCIPTTWSSKLFGQEVRTAGVDMLQIPAPFAFHIQDDEAGAHVIESETAAFEERARSLAIDITETASRAEDVDD